MTWQLFVGLAWLGYGIYTISDSLSDINSTLRRIENKMRDDEEEDDDDEEF